MKIFNKNNVQKPFEEIIDKIDLKLSISNYKQLKQEEKETDGDFRIYSNLLKSLNSKDSKKLQILYEESLKKLTRVKVLSAVMEEQLNFLKIVASEPKIQYNVLDQLAEIFKEKFAKYDTAFSEFKDVFAVLKKILDNKHFNKQKTR